MVLELTGLPEDLPHVSTAVAKGSDGNTVWNERLVLEVPPPEPGADAPQLLVRVMQRVRLLPDRWVRPVVLQPAPHS